MKKSLRKIYILILVIILLPSLFFAIYEIGTLQQNEEVIEDIYENQLDAILYSINQYAEDVVSSWANTIEDEQQSSPSLQMALESALREMPSVKGIIQFDSALQKVAMVQADSAEIRTITQVIDRLTLHKEVVGRLFGYFRSGYRKIESISQLDSSQLLAFVTYHQERPMLNAIILDSRAFINEVLDPKMQEIASERFYLLAFHRTDDQLVYSSDKQYLPEQVEYRKAFWILNDYFLGIEMKDKTIKELASERSQKELVIIAIVELVLLLGVWIIFRNVRKQMELAQIKADFVSNVSHEIRTPLALISMYIESLERGVVKSPEKIKEYYAISLQETRRLTAIVNKILNFSQIESGKREFIFEEVPINDVVEDVINTFRLNLENQAFSWEVALSEDDPFITADREAVTDAVVNLVDNAIKYSNSTKQIHLRTGMDRSTVFVEVQDHGLGISKAEQKHIFDKFYRVTQENLAHKAKGSGVGLAIVQYIMEAHQGSVTVKSAPGKSSTFRLIFPKSKISSIS
jgi:two-component system phosphate regulon sensor histidine kinase PhoR